MRELVFTEAAVPLPFVFVIGTYSNGRRRLDATIEELVDCGRSLANKEEIAAALRNRLLPPLPNHDIEITAGADATAALAEDFRVNAAWPAVVAASLTEAMRGTVTILIERAPAGLWRRGAAAAPPLD